MMEAEMGSALDNALNDLRDQPADRDLSQLEPRVWARIDGAREGRFSAGGFVPARIAAVVGSLLIGAVVGGASATAMVAKPSDTAVFAVNTRLAPSTLLDVR